MTDYLDISDIPVFDRADGGRSKEALKRRNRKKSKRNIEREKQYAANRKTNIAILDFETDPFDADAGTSVYPFCAVLYWRDLETDEDRFIVEWSENHVDLCDRMIEAIKSLPDAFTVYAHNGGKFDFLFLLSRLRGRVIFKGRALMSARIGRHELRDSLHIIPTKLADFQKDEFDYNWMRKNKRKKYREQIIQYCKNDCKYLYGVVLSFIQTYGRQISIGSAAIKELGKFYSYEKLGPKNDEFLRPFFFGGRVECLRGSLHWKRPNEGAPLHLYDVNSMYPSVMANFLHPVGAEFRVRTDGRIRDETCFLEVECDSDGAFLCRQKNGGVNVGYGLGTYRVTIHEYLVAQRFGRIRNARVLATVDFQSLSNFRSFVDPIYAEREIIKARLDELPEYSDEWNSANQQSLFLKLILNNAYGKFAQNPRRFTECILTDPDVEYPVGYEWPTLEDLEARRIWSAANGTEEDEPEWNYWGQLDPFSKSGVGPSEKYEHYWIWRRPTQRQKQLFNNVATGASITGAARARLLEALCLAKNPLYCDTDSVICEGLEGVEIDKAKLGAWKLECQIDELAIAGKKLYAYRYADEDKSKEKVRSKGAGDLNFERILAMVRGESFAVFAARAPLIGRDGSQHYIKRVIKKTA